MNHILFAMLACCAHSQTLPLTLLYTHPEAAAQPTGIGRVIRTLHDFNGVLYSGYGDWGANTGPVTIRSFELATGISVPEYTFRTEQLARFVTVGERLYAVAADPGGGGNEEFAYRTAASAWSGHNSPFSLVHVFDLVSLDGVGIWLVGQRSWDIAVAFHSPDGGATWDAPTSPAHLELTGTPQSAGYNRFHFAGVYQGKVYTQSPHYSGSRVFNPALNAWTVGPNLLRFPQECYGNRPVEFAGKMVYHSDWGNWYGRLMAFDGSRVTDPLKSIARKYNTAIDLQVYGGYLYALVQGGDGYAVIRTPDLARWELAGRIEIGADIPMSLRIVGAEFYVGATEAHIYSAVFPGAFPSL